MTNPMLSPTPPILHTFRPIFNQMLRPTSSLPMKSEFSRSSISLLPALSNFSGRPQLSPSQRLLAIDCTRIDRELFVAGAERLSALFAAPLWDLIGDHIDTIRYLSLLPPVLVTYWGSPKATTIAACTVINIIGLLIQKHWIFPSNEQNGRGSYQDSIAYEPAVSINAGNSVDEPDEPDEDSDSEEEDMSVVD